MVRDEDAEFAAARAAVFDAVRTLLAQGGLPLRPLGLHAAPATGKQAAYVWRSRQPWLGPHAQSAERALLFTAVDVVERIATSAAWTSTHLDDHRIRLDLTFELDEIDDQAHHLAGLRHQLGAETPPEPAWHALVDRVAALWLYANRLRALESELARQAADDRAALLEMNAATFAARDELATDHLRALADDLPHRSPGEITN